MEKRADEKFCFECGALIRAKAEICPKCGVRQPLASMGPTGIAIPSGKNRLAAAVLAILFGAFGVHRFYLGHIVLGIIYLLFCWTGITFIIGLIEGIFYLSMSDEAFGAKYGTGPPFQSAT